jgi:hypothetical protein
LSKFKKEVLKVKLPCRSRELVPINIAGKADTVPSKETFKWLDNNSIQYLSCGDDVYEVNVHRTSST